MALLSTYSCPEDVDLSLLFCNGFNEETVTPEEEEKVIAIVREENGEPMIKVTADPKNDDFSYYD